jgi:ferrous iron transport protein B
MHHCVDEPDAAQIVCGSGGVKRRRVVIAGPPNSGKSAMFNWLSSSYSEVSNYPHSTVSCVKGEFVSGGETYDVWDTPGISSLDAATEVEALSRDVLLKEKPSIIIMLLDATRLKRSLMLFSEISDISVPVALVLSKADVAWKNGTAISLKALSTALGAPVFGLRSDRRISGNEISSVIESARIMPTMVNVDDFEINEALDAIRKSATADGACLSRAEVISLLSGGALSNQDILANFHENTRLDVEGALKTFQRKRAGANVQQAFFRARSSWVDKVAHEAESHAHFSVNEMSQLTARAFRHPILGWPILLGVIWLTFKGVATLAPMIANIMDAVLFAPLVGLISKIVTIPALHDFLLGQYGVLTMGLINALETVTPILLVFFLIVGFLEEIGYMPNLSVLLNRMFAMMGLTGKAALCMSVGFGCNTMATMASRMLETRRERVIASFLIALGVPCAVQLGVLIAILSSLPFSALLIVLGTILATQAGCGLAMNRLLMGKGSSNFILELPGLKAPDLKNIVRKTYLRVKSFLIEATPVFMAAAVFMFMLDKIGALELLKKAMHPLVAGALSLPDKAVEVFIMVIARRELGAVYFKNMADAGEMDYIQIVVGLVVITLFIPCISNTMMMIKEIGMKASVYINSAIIVIAILAGVAVNVTLRALL